MLGPSPQPVAIKRVKVEKCLRPASGGSDRGARPGSGTSSRGSSRGSVIPERLSMESLPSDPPERFVLAENVEHKSSSHENKSRKPMTKTIMMGPPRTQTPSTPKSPAVPKPSARTAYERSERPTLHEVPAVSRENGRAPPDYDEVDACEHIKHIEAMRKRLETLERSQEADHVSLEAAYDVLKEQLKDDVPADVKIALHHATSDDASTANWANGATAESESTSQVVLIGETDGNSARPTDWHRTELSNGGTVQEPFLTAIGQRGAYIAPPTPSTPGESEVGDDDGDSRLMLSMLEKRLEQMQSEQVVRRCELDEYLEKLHAKDEDGESLVDFGSADEYDQLVMQAEASFASSGLFAERSLPTAKPGESDEQIEHGMAKIDELDMVLLDKTRNAKRVLSEHARRNQSDPFLTEVDNAVRVGADTKRPSARQLVRTLRNAPSAATTAAVEVQDFMSKNKLLSGLGKFMSLTAAEDARVEELLAMTDDTGELLATGMGFGLDVESQARLRSIDERLQQMLGDDAFAQLVEQDSHPLAEPQRRTVMASDEQIGDERQDGAIDWLWVLQQDRKLNKRMHCINSQLATVHKEADRDKLSTTSMDDLLCNLRSISIGVETTLAHVGEIGELPDGNEHSQAESHCDQSSAAAPSDSESPGELAATAPTVEPGSGELGSELTAGAEGTADETPPIVADLSVTCC